MWIKNILIQADKNLLDITDEINEYIKGTECHRGLCNIASLHTTCGISIFENEMLLLADISKKLEEFSPKDGKYLHNMIELRDVPPDERINGDSHIKMLLINSSITIPVKHSKLWLGKWQRVFLAEMDFRAPQRWRDIIVTVWGNIDDMSKMQNGNNKTK